MDENEGLNHSWRDKTNTTQGESSRSRGTFRGGRWNNNYRSRGDRGGFNSRWAARSGRGGRYVTGTNQNGNTENYQRKAFDEKIASYGIGYQEIEDLCNDMDQRKILSGSSEFLEKVQKESFYKRLDDLWPDVKKQSNFLRVIVATASLNQQDVRTLTHIFISKILDSKLLEKIVENCICPLMYDPIMQETPVYAEIAHNTVKLLLRGFETLPSKMDQHLANVVSVITTLKEVKDICVKEETKIPLETLEIALKQRQKSKAAQRLTAETQKLEEKEFEGSAGEPPKNFRELSVVPTPEDISYRLPPYLRAAKVKGRYDSDEQYLDIQFRLLREDLIRPLRDGITAYRKGGTKETDLYVYHDVEIGASLMHKQTGELISYAFINVTKKRMRWDKRLKYDLPLIEHRCIGICGEECIKICKICDPEKFSEIQQIFFGTEDDENARFLQLKDCGHIFEVSGLDNWIKSSLAKPGDENSSTEIVQIKCPQCKTSIRRSKRYISILNERAVDIEQIKQKTRGLTIEEKKKEQAAFGEEVKQVFKIFRETDFGKTTGVEGLEKKLTEAHPNVLTKDWFSTSRNILRIIQTLTKYENRAKENIEAFDRRLSRYEESGMYKKIDVVKVDDIKNMPNFKEKLLQLKITNFWGYLKDECNYLVARIHPFEISEPMIQQITYEIQRFGFTVDLFTYFSKAIKQNIDFTQEEIEKISEIFENMNGNKEFNDNFENEMSQKLEKLASIHCVTNFGISQKERIEIIKAVGSDVTHWYKCPNGHTYGIGDCGGAVMTTKCPECKEEIGGQFHRILGSNQDAQAEMFEGTEIHANPYRNPFEVRW